MGRLESYAMQWQSPFKKKDQENTKVETEINVTDQTAVNSLLPARRLERSSTVLFPPLGKHYPKNYPERK